MEKNICWFDLETTGLKIPKDSIVEISAIKTDSNLKKIDEFYSLVRPNEPYEIDPTATEKHGLTKEMLKDAPTFKDISKKLLDFIGDCDLGGYNIAKFDMAMIVEEFLRAGIVLEYKNRNIIDGYAIYNKWESRTLEATYARLFGKPLEDAHNAEADIMATIAVYKKQREMYDLPTPNEIDKICFADKKFKLDLAQKFVANKDKDIIFNFGKHKGKTIEEVYNCDNSYFDWVANNGDFELESRKLAAKLKHYVFKKLYGNDKK